MAVVARGDSDRPFWQFEWDPPVALAWGVYGGAWYVWKTLWPTGLAAVYRMPTREDPMAGHLLLAAGTVAGLTLGLVGLRRRWPGALAAWVAFGVLIAPVSGLVPFGRLRGVADRYTYAACIGWALVAGAAWALAWEAPWVRRARGRRALVAACVVAVLFGWSAFAWSQARIWRDSVSLWRWTVAVVPDSPLAHYKLGWALAYAGELDTAEVHVRRAADAWPEHPEVLQNLARILARRGRLEEAAAVLRRAVAVAPRAAGLRADLGSVLEASGELDRAADELQGALRLDPGDWRAHEYLGRVRARQGREAEALVHRRRAAEQRGAVSPAADRDGGAPVPPEGEGPSAPW
jgi:tetratricopeptide (TPR) repeat protein